MSGLNISELLGSSGDSTTTTLFSSLSTSSKTSSSSSIFDSISLTDYASIKNGSYYKLMKKQYSEDTEVSDEDLEAYEKKLTITSDKASKLAADINNLMDCDFSEDNREDVISGIEDFVSSYNSMLDNSASSDSKSIRQQSEWLTNMVNEYSGSLEDIGISVSADGSLSIDSDALEAADMSDIKNVFGTDVNNLSNKILYKSEQIYSLAKTYGSSATAYTSSGAYNRNYSDSNYDTSC